MTYGHVWADQTTHCHLALSGRPHPSIQRVQQRVASAVSHTAAPMGLPAFPKLEALSTKSALVDLPIFSSAERHAVILQLNH